MNKYTIIPSSQQYKSAPAVDQDIDISLNQKTRLLTEFDRSASINLEQVFDNERQTCTVFRPTFKLTYLYANTLSGTTNYLPFQYNLYYVDPISSMQSRFWYGLPQYYEFDLIRTDYNTSGYTTPDSNGDFHLNFIPKSSTSYNWNVYISYPFKNLTNRTLESISVVPGLANTTLTWNVSIPL